MSRYLNENLARLAPYVPGEQPQDKTYIKLNTNENPYFPSKYSMERITRGELENLRLYSDPENTELSEVIAAYYGVNSKEVLPVNGSDEALAFAFCAFGGCGAVFPDVTYGFYKVFAGLFGVDYKELPLNADFTVDCAAYMRVKRTVFLANPNAQTGIYLPVSEIEKIIASNPDNVVVIDEAYVDFGGESCVPLIKKYKNLVIVQTFSKSRSLAGARAGFAIADESLINDLKRVKFSFNPYNVNRLSSALAAEAMRDRKYFEECVDRIIFSRESLISELKTLGFEVLPSKANFVLAKYPQISGEKLYKELKARGVLVRHFTDRRISDYVRITIGSDGDMRVLTDKIKEII